MIIKSLRIKNYKGISDTRIRFDRCKNANIFTLAGLNESGKTTILEAIERFSMGEVTEENPIVPQGFGFNNNEKPQDFIPKHLRGSFSDDVIFGADVELTEDDITTIAKAFNDTVNQFEDENKYLELGVSQLKKETKIVRSFVFENSEFKDVKLDLHAIFVRGRDTERFTECQNPQILNAISIAVENLLPSINFFPAALSEFPEKIFLNRDVDKGRVNKCYRDIISDILASQDMSIEEQILNRLGKNGDKDALSVTLGLIEQLIDEHVVAAWENVFPNTNETGRQERRTRVKVTESGNNPSLEITLTQGGTPYKIHETSLGHRWFFCFLMFTNFRKHRVTDRPLFFLLDEPAANLHPTAQSRMLGAFSAIATENCKLIYTTHSPYMINPNWLESTLIVRDDASAEDFVIGEATVNVNVAPYRQIISQSQDDTPDYCRIILDALDYSVPKIDLLSDPPKILLEGVGDHALFGYFQQVEFKDDTTFLFVPGQGSQKSIPVLQLLSGYGARYLVLLDGDASGQEAKNKILNTHFTPDDAVLLLTDIDNNFTKLEDLISANVKAAIMGKNETGANEKKAIRAYFQEHLARREKIDCIDLETRSNVNAIYTFLSDKIQAVWSN